MTRLTLLLYVLLTASYALGQGCPEFTKLVAAGTTYQKAKRYEKALKKYNAAKLCAPEQAKAIDQKITQLFNDIEKDKQDAIKGKQDAIKQRNIARLAQLDAEKARKDAVNQRDLARQARRDAIKAREVAQQQTAEAKALYWASESDKLNPDQAIRLLEKASKVILGTSPIYERIIKLVNNRLV